MPPTVEKTPIASMTIHSTAEATIVQMPSAMESRKLTFITDHGSALATRSRALRVRGVVRAPVRGRRTAPAGPAARVGLRRVVRPGLLLRLPLPGQRGGRAPVPRRRLRLRRAAGRAAPGRLLGLRTSGVRHGPP